MANDVEVIEIIPDAGSPPVVIAVPGGGSGGGGGGGTYVHVQVAPSAVWEIEHRLGHRPAAVTVFAPGYAFQYDEFMIQHVSINELRLGMETPVAGIALIPR